MTLHQEMLEETFKVFVGTLNQGYPLLWYEDAVPIRRSLATR
jgi:hypothetical protein